MTKKTKAILREEPQADGSIQREYMDGSREIIAPQGKSLAKLNITDAQIEAWKKQPKEQALKEALELFRSQGMDISEAKFKLEVLKFISELQGATQPALPQGMQMLSVHVNIAQPPVKIKDVVGGVIIE